MSTPKQIHTVAMRPDGHTHRLQSRIMTLRENSVLTLAQQLHI